MGMNSRSWSGKPVVQFRSVRKASCAGQVGQEGQLSRSFRSGMSVVQVRSVRKANCAVRSVRKVSCAGQVGQEGHLCRSGRSGRPVVQVRSVRKASCAVRSVRKTNQHISGFQEAKVNERIKESTNWQTGITEKLNFCSCNVYGTAAGLVYKIVCWMDAAPARGSNTEQAWKRVSDHSLAAEARVLTVSTV